MPYEFIKTPDEANRFEVATVSMKLPSEVSLSEMLEHFEQFLKGAGWIFDGSLDFVSDDPPEPDIASETYDEDPAPRPNENVSDDSHSV